MASYKLRKICGLLLVHDRPGFSYIYLQGRSPNSAENIGMKLFSTNSKTRTNLKSNMVSNDQDMAQPSVPAPPRQVFSFPHWTKWVLGSALTFSLLPWNQEYWGKLQRIEGEAEVVVEDVENVVEIVEKVATVAEKVSEKVADKFPENGKLKEAALLVERVSKEAAQDAQLTEDFIHKVDKLKNDLETLVHPVVDHTVKQESERK